MSPCTATMSPPAAKRGRRVVTTIPAERVKHLQAYHSRRILRFGTSVIARIMDVDRKTVQRWVKLASGYPESRYLGRSSTTEDIRALCAARKAL